jgi:class 3 adenylate cyclase
VAACGVPVSKGENEHAVIIAEFSRDIMTATNKVVNELKQIIGEDTSNLALRIGIHSGPVIGGVLRGRKSRFQLFGETVDVANKTESQGEKKSIHVSQAAAFRLARAGNEDWLIPRELTDDGPQTYWLRDDQFDDDNPNVEVHAEADAAVTGMLQHLDGNEKPMAKLFRNCTLFFGDIQGFARWASLRDPDQVFMLLENVFSAFDKIAERRDVFKVETVGKFQGLLFLRKQK